MTDPFVAEIRIFGFNFPPRGWAFCDGQLMPISQNTALFSLLGTFYGGDGASTFALPDLQGQAAVGSGQGQGLSDYYLGQQAGSESVSLIESEIPNHSHTAQASSAPAELQAPANDRALARSSGGFAYRSDPSAGLVQMDPQALAPVGSDFPHNNMPPVLTLNFCIALQGVFPQRP
ncbi:phage tail protein [Conexibacter woesei]|uniref:Tail Collar domain protein n=1 Tax=Conexibacter woesei (strain DSM 14684 / CCUG 47730 / CIP 108061 / JCM 11494 / NBRC 100937 / ID131577) TaxID=469383 RepID=D3F8R2_CONWI|nr:tail fiber protein [Conexibacter woesei]ADB51026.1 Tail Collar domain protein [Conexibacter woesei DSM 14684]